MILRNVMVSLDNKFGVGCVCDAGQWTRFISCKNTSFLLISFAPCVVQYVREGQYDVHILWTEETGL